MSAQSPTRGDSARSSMPTMPIAHAEIAPPRSRERASLKSSQPGSAAAARVGRGLSRRSFRPTRSRVASAGASSRSWRTSTTRWPSSRCSRTWASARPRTPSRRRPCTRSRACRSMRRAGRWRRPEDRQAARSPLTTPPEGVVCLRNGDQICEDASQRPAPLRHTAQGEVDGRSPPRWRWRRLLSPPTASSPSGLPKQMAIG